jgi:hypothetical protein
MGLTEIYQKGKKILGEKEFGWVLGTDHRKGDSCCC